MTKSPADASPAPLKAFGGWADAAWFSPTVLSDTAVVGFNFPPAASLAKQNFRVIDRSAGAKPVGKGGKTAAVALPKGLAARLGVTLDEYAAIRAVACCRSRFLFESGPVLFFADIPLSKLKQAAANKLRRAIIENGLRACVVRLEAASAMLMFWAAADSKITEFVETADPDHPLHPDFDKAELGATPAKAAPKAAPVSDAHAQARTEKLLREVTALRAEVTRLQRSQTAIGAMEALGLDDARLKSMLMLLHPDKHGNSEAATEAAKWLNNLRAVLKEKPP